MKKMCAPGCDFVKPVKSSFMTDHFMVVLLFWSSLSLVLVSINTVLIDFLCVHVLHICLCSK